MAEPPFPSTISPFMGSLFRQLPWFRSELLRFCAQAKVGRVPHAMLLAGPADSGKRAFALDLAYYLLCHSPGDGRHCGNCKACQLLEAGSHPDLFFVSPPEGKKEIAIDTIRSMQEKATQTAQQSGSKVCVITPAEAMNAHSENALLKLLEEPPANTYFLLLADSPSELLPTTLSRCQQYRFARPDSALSSSWLAAHFPDKDIDQVMQTCRGYPMLAYRQLESEQGVADFSALVAKGFARGSSGLHVVAKLDASDYLPFLDESINQVQRCLVTRFCSRKDDPSEVESMPFEARTTEELQNLQLLMQRVRAQMQSKTTFNNRLLLESLLAEAQL